MKRIGITQRVEVTATGERRDCLDQQWASFFQTLKMCPIPLPNHLTEGGAKEVIKNYDLHGVLLTGGNDPVGFGGNTEAPERDRFEHELLKECAELNIPVIGICRGAEILFIHHGGKIAPIKGHVGVRHLVNNIEVNSYHSFGLDKNSLPICLEICGRAEDGSIEAFRHNSLPQAAVLWHPERETPFQFADLNLFKTIFGEKA